MIIRERERESASEFARMLHNLNIPLDFICGGDVIESSCHLFLNVFDDGEQKKVK